MIPVRKVTAMIAAGPAAALLAAGCGTSGTSNNQAAAAALSPARAISLAAHQAKTISSFSSTMTEKLSGLASGTITGTMQVQTRPSLFTRADFNAFSIAGHSMPGGMQEILTSKAIYVKMALFSQHLHKPWAEIPYSALQQRTGINLGQLLQQVQGSNPLVQTQMLASAKNVRAVGTQTIGGVKTTHYTGSYSLSAGIARLPASMRAAALKALQGQGNQAVHFSVWIDAQHQTRQLAVSLGSSAGQMTMTMTITAINQPVSTALPPASQVATIPASVLGGSPGATGTTGA
jgi:hypothetical protein